MQSFQIKPHPIPNPDVIEEKTVTAPFYSKILRFDLDSRGWPCVWFSERINNKEVDYSISLYRDGDQYNALLHTRHIGSCYYKGDMIHAFVGKTRHI